ncbi:hypothetical protein H5410_051129 [Solanum commersonii]|uniref:Uncharacterized protein n=1 Tax=Solanum commersonii TaxID=4109 RepID=A0A9J5WZT5_SOLCO|nr:hypothetical protein H5410_051129 [Solanum commersonii]
MYTNLSFHQWEPFGIVSRDRRYARRSAIWFVSAPFSFYLQHLRILDHWHTRTKGEDKTFWRLTEWVRRFSDLHFFILVAVFVPFC